MLFRYEYDTYEEIAKEMPAPGSDIVTSKGRGRVLGQEILAKQLLVQMEDDRRILIALDEVLTVLRKGSKPKWNKDREGVNEDGIEEQANATQVVEREERGPAKRGSDEPKE